MGTHTVQAAGWQSSCLDAAKQQTWWAAQTARVAAQHWASGHKRELQWGQWLAVACSAYVQGLWLFSSV